jgi:hypothetical protein
MADRSWQNRYLSELAHAREARSADNEGMARVCARRAAGILAEQFLLRREVQIPTHEAYDLLRQLQAMRNFPPQVTETAGKFLMRVDHNHQLPADIDLIAEVDRLYEALAAENPDLWTGEPGEKN